MKAFYNQLHEVFQREETKDLYRQKGIAPVQFIDLYAGQDYMEQFFEAHLFPAILVRWTIAYADNHEAVATLTFRLCYEQLRDLSNLGKSKDEGLKFLDFITITDKILKTIETPTTGKLHLISEELNIEETIIDVFTLTYQCSYSGKQKAPLTESKQGNYDAVEITKRLKARF